MIRKIISGVGAVFDEIKLRVASIWDTTKKNVSRFLSGDGGFLRMVVDITASVGIVMIAPHVGIGIAAANFTDDLDGFGAVLSLAGAFALLEFIALWSLEVIAVLVAIQFSRITTRFISNYKKRRADESERLTSRKAA